MACASLLSALSLRILWRFLARVLHARPPSVTVAGSVRCDAVIEHVTQNHFRVLVTGKCYFKMGYRNVIIVTEDGTVIAWQPVKSQSQICAWTVVYWVMSLSVKDILNIWSGLHANVIVVIVSVLVIRFSTFIIGRPYVLVCNRNRTIK